MEINIEQVKAEIERLRTLNADEYLADKIAELKAEFEAKREQNIADLERFLELCDEYEVVEEAEDETEEAEDNGQEAQFIEG